MLSELIKKENFTSDELETLLKAREEGKINFKLIDVREPYEHEEAHIVGTDELLPTSRFQEWAKDLLDRDEDIVIYCRTGNRTGQVQAILKQYGKTIPHLSYGIMGYRGEIKSGS